jgi:hypothetical protein
MKDKDDKEQLRKRSMDLLRLDAAIIEANDKILQYPEQDPRSKLAFEEKFDLIKRRHALVTGDPVDGIASLSDVSFSHKT